MSSVGKPVTVSGRWGGEWGRRNMGEEKHVWERRRERRWGTPDDHRQRRGFTRWTTGPGFIVGAAAAGVANLFKCVRQDGVPRWGRGCLTDRSVCESAEYSLGVTPPPPAHLSPS